MRKSMRTVGVIPARYASSRFEGKPLVDIRGKPMIQHVYERASRAETMDEVVVATDDSRIYNAVAGFGGSVIMTPEFPTGTDRVAYVADGWIAMLSPTFKAMSRCSNRCCLIR